VIDPLRETNTDSVTTSSGQTISLALSTEDRTFNDSSFVEVDITASQLTGNDVNVVFIWDGSGSLNSSEYATELNAIQTTLNALDAEFAGSATDVDVKLIQFSREPAGGNGIRESGVFDLDDPALDNVAALPVASQLGGGTDYAPPINAAFSFLNSEPAGEENFVFFASDGQPNFGTNFGNIGGLQAIADVQAFGFGSGVTSGSAINALNTVDSDNAVILPGASDLANAFATSPLFAADLVDFSLKVEGFEIANKGNLVPLGTGNFEFDDTLTSLLNGLGDSTTVEATATFDTDNDGSADETLVAQTIINGTDGSDIIFA